jgi:hypothetical protein
MPSIEIKGSVWPRGTMITLPDLKFAMTNTSTSLTTTFECHCQDSRITIKCNAPEMVKGDPASVGFVVENARMLFDGAISLLSVHAGRSSRFIVESLSFEGAELDLNMEYAALAGLITAFKLDEFVSTISSISGDVEVLLVLQDLNAAMSEPFYTSVGCGRAVDGLRHAIAGPDGDPDARKWPELRQALNVDRSYVQAIMSASQRGRHGQRLVSHGHDLHEILRRTWVLFNRFLEYRKRGNVPLTLPDFPPLMG